MKILYEVTYKDDFNYTHIVFLADWYNILFLKERYGEENVQVIKETRKYFESK